MHESERLESDAEVLARILASLLDGEGVPQAVGVVALPLGRRVRRVWAGERAADDVRGGLPAPPPWATHGVIEDGGVTHERVSSVHPLAFFGAEAPGSRHTCPTDVSVSVVDRPGAVRWVRLPPTIQIEGGSYGIAEARRLVRAVEGLIALVAPVG